MKSVREGLSNEGTFKQRPEGSEREPIWRSRKQVFQTKRKACANACLPRNSWEARVSKVKGDKIGEAEAGPCQVAVDYAM